MLPFTIIQAIQLELTQGLECFSEAGVEKIGKDAVKRGKYFPAGKLEIRRWSESLWVALRWVALTSTTTNVSDWRLQVWKGIFASACISGSADYNVNRGVLKQVVMGNFKRTLGF